MTEINRMEDPIIPTSLEEVTLIDPEIQECPFPTYDFLREEAPIFKDPITGMFVVTRYLDLRRIALDYDNFSNHRYSNDPDMHSPSQQIAHKLFKFHLNKDTINDKTQRTRPPIPIRLARP